MMGGLPGRPDMVGTYGSVREVAACVGLWAKLFRYPLPFVERLRTKRTGNPDLTMNQHEMIQSLRAEISKLQRALDALLDEPSTPEPVRRPGRPSGSTDRATSFNPEEFAPKKRTMSAEGKARIAAAQKKRWAAQKGSPVSGGYCEEECFYETDQQRRSPQTAGKVAPTKAKKRQGQGREPARPRLVC